MFKKLKQKINEEQSPQRNALSPQQAQVKALEKHGKSPGLHQDAPSSSSDRESITKGAVSSPSGSVNGDGAASPLAKESQSLAQKLQQRVSSVESLFRVSGRAEGLFRSGSRDSLVRSASRESLTPLGENEAPGAPAFDPPSDIESEAEDAPGNTEALSKEQLLYRLHRVEKSLANYRGKYSELVTAYRTVQRDKEKTQAILSQSQDKALRRIGELREELQMDQQAKKHLQEEFDAALEEKDQMITVLQTQVALMKKRIRGCPEALVSPEAGDTQTADSPETTSDTQSTTQVESVELNQAGGSGEPGNAADLDVLQKRVRRQETLLQRCKELINSNRECSAQLSSENDALQQQLQERLQELEKMKELHTSEKTKLITQLRDAKNLIEQLEQDKGMVIAETKRQMHETLEMKEEEIAQLRTRIQQTVAQKEELQEQREKAEKAAFEELERALGVAQRAEEARRQLQERMEEQVKQVEQASEEERRSLQQELTRVKQEVITIMKKSAEDKVAEMEQQHLEDLAKKDKQMRTQINEAVENCRKELLKAAQEKEQQASLAVEEAELQKSAVQAEGEAKARELQLELESTRTRILELESSLAKSSQGEATQADQMLAEIEEQRKKYEAEIAALEERHQQELEKLKAEHTDTLNQQHATAVEELVQKHKSEIDMIMKDKELEFQDHVKEMNQKVLEKLDIKQEELEALSSELSEMRKCKEQLEEKLAADAANESDRREFEVRLKEEQLKFQMEVEDIKRQHEQLLEGLEKTLKEELNQLRMVLEEKDKELEQYVVRERILQEDAKKAQQDVEAKIKEIEDLRGIAQSEKEALAEAGAQYDSLKEELEQSKSQVQNLERLVEVGHNDCQQKEECLQQKTNENEELKQRMQQALSDLAEKGNSHAQSQQAMQEELNRLSKQLDEERSSYEKRAESLRKELDSKLKSQETKMEKLKQKAKEMQEKLKKKLHEQEENAKAEIAKKDKELQQKDQQVKDKILEMAQTNSEGLSSALSDLEANHKEQLEKIHDVHRLEQEELLRLWQEKLSQQEEELQEKHALSLQEKVQELEDISQQLLTNREEKEQVVQEVKNLREELSMRETTVQKLQAELREAAVKLESLSEVEGILKKQLETVEKNLNQALNERNLFQDQLTKTEETSKERFQALSEELEDACKKLNALEASRNKEGQDLQRTLEEKTTELQNKETQFLTQICGISKELEQHCQGAQTMLIGFSDHLCERVEAKVNELQNRIMCNQRKLCHFKNVILTKNDKICSLEKELQQTVEESQSLKHSLDQMALQLSANSENLKALTTERESLQKEASNHSQVLSEKVLCIEKLDEENKNISEKLKANILHISNLESIIDDLKNQLSGTITEKEEAISLLNQQHSEEKQSIRSQVEEAVVRAEKEKGLAVEQVDTLRNKLSELKKKTDTKLTQNHNTIRSLQCKMEDMEKQIAEKDEHLQRLTASIDNQSISKSEMDQVLSEKEQRVSALTLELDDCTKKISELEERLELQSKDQEQLEAVLQQQRHLRESEKMELMQQLQQTKEQCSHKSDLVCETEEKLQSLEQEFQNVKQQLESQQGDFEREKAEILKSKEEALKAAEESASKVAELRKKAEQKISLLRKQLTAQIEQKEQTIKDLQAQLEDIKQRQNEKEQQVNSLEENGRKMEEAINNLREEHKKHLEQVQHDGKLENENPLQTVKDMNSEELATETSVQNKAAAAIVSEREEEALSRLRELEAKLIESEEQNTTRQAEISQLQAELREQMVLVQELQQTCLSLEVQVKEKETVSLEKTNSLLEMEPVQYAGEQDTKLKQEAWESEKDLLVKDYEMKLQDLCKRLEEKEGQLKVQENFQIGPGQTDGECLTDGSKSPESHLQRKVVETENEKQKIQKDYTRLQKDLRSLRKEHEKELEYLRKEMEDESEKKLALEMDDLEMKHNSALKQMMREFNTQIALKDKELEVSVKEAVEKAQRVEAELMGIHREEANQLQKIISQKDDDLKRTVQRYEQILQSREDEMGTRVWEVQKELEELQHRSLSGPQVQLAEKTTLLSEARLKEQEYQDRIHTLEDTVRKAYKNSVVTHLGKEPSHYSADPFTEPTEFEYLRKVMFEYMMGRETKTMAKVITSMLKFPADQAQKVLEREDSRVMPWLRALRMYCRRTRRLTCKSGMLDVFAVCLSLSLVYAYNIDLEHPLVFRGPNATFFGYSVLEHFHDNTRWILVGAPRANSSFSNSVHSPGAVYKCRIHSNPERRCTEIDLGRGNKKRESCGKTCQGDRDDEWMGVSLARQDKPNGRVLACAHRWKNVYYESEYILPHGYCSVIAPTLQGRTQALIPCYEDHKKTYGEEHGSCQAGIAGAFMEELVVMGAPGSYYWTGTVKVFNITSNTQYSLNKNQLSSQRYSYLGYAVTAGHFSSPTAIDIAAGAPQDGGGGKVYVFRIDGVSLVKVFQASGKMMGSYFGSSLCAVDLNADGLSDLLVGAPMFSEVRDEGQVSVYISRGNGVMEDAMVLNGDNAYNAHFGECISAIGDIDDDGYQDVAIGAPKEDDFGGAVYIYHGDAKGIVNKYSMRLSGRSMNPTFQMFGQSISGNVDMDGNGYPDVTIGAFMADSVVLLRSKPVITVDVSIFLPTSINITVPQCHEGPQHLNCFNVTVCMRFRGKLVPGRIELLYNLTADADKRYKGLSSRVYFTHGGEQTGAVSKNFSLSINQQECHHYTAYVRKEVKDVFAAITFEASYRLGKHVLDVRREHELASLSPVLRWRKGEKIAARNETWFEKNCLSDDCAADLKLHGKLLLSGHHIRPHLALGGVKNVSLNITIVNAGDDAYDTNIYLNFSREVHYINFLQREEKGISCELIQLDFLKCSVGFPFMRAQTKYHLSVLFDTSHLSGENETLLFLVHARSVVTPSSFVYGNSVDSSRFVQLEDLECNFQPLNFTFQVINNGPSRLPGSTVDIRIPNMLVGNGADMFHIIDTQVAEGRGNCTWHRNPTPCIIPQDRESIFHAIFAFFTKSGRRVLDCDRPGRACLTISCSLGSQAKDEAIIIDVQMLLNTETLKKDSSSVIQFVTRSHVQVDSRAMEVSSGLPEDISLVFEALHSQEPRGYVVGWIIAISLLVGILIFLLLAVLLWKMGFFRRRYREIIEAEKNRKDSDESWDWVQKSE
ncbi:hypothetical protein PDJAM_G00189280 [Pangasius djambal]|uniref:Uncharacterized protein n=1 Tax=Pangasius djambal TaxID=1691987 RepID=A0ACC5Y529_9TELE|nr:hypothetical protein [Pangasius djambal]